jgi:hypothetical protein
VSDLTDGRMENASALGAKSIGVATIHVDSNFILCQFYGVSLRVANCSLLFMHLYVVLMIDDMMCWKEIRKLFNNGRHTNIEASPPKHFPEKTRKQKTHRYSFHHIHQKVRQQSVS